MVHNGNAVSVHTNYAEEAAVRELHRYPGAFRTQDV